MPDSKSTPSVPTPHGEKLTALVANPKLPPADLPRVENAIVEYEKWRALFLSETGSREEIINSLVSQLNAYKKFIEFDLIFDSPRDWLYRQKGQTKLDNSIIEEFLPALVLAVFGDRFEGEHFEIGPTTCYSNLRFHSTVSSLNKGAGAAIRAKDQDFAISRPVYIRTSHFADFSEATTNQTNLAYIAAECKTNLDTTMFQEAAATAPDVKTSVPGARYYLLCEWLDMTPISTTVTPIDEIIILRKAKRLSSTVRSGFSKASGRKEYRSEYENFLDSNPFSVESFSRFMTHIDGVLEAESLETKSVLKKGYF